MIKQKFQILDFGFWIIQYRWWHFFKRAILCIKKVKLMSSNHFTRSEQNMIKFYPKISCWKCKKTLEICSHFVDWQSLFFRYFACKAFDVCMCANKLKLSFFCPLMSITLHRQSVFWPHPLLSMALGMNWRNFHCNFIVDVHNLFFSVKMPLLYEMSLHHQRKL